MVTLDDIRVGWRRSLRLAAATLACGLLRRIARTTGTLAALLGCVLILGARLLARELSTVGLLLRHGAVVHAALLACWPPCVRNNIIGSALAAAFVLGYCPIPIVRIGVLEDDVPGVEQAGEEAEAAKSDIDEGVGGTHTALNPHYSACQYMIVGDRATEVISSVGAWSGCSRTSDGWEKDAEEHQKAVGAAHDYGV